MANTSLTVTDVNFDGIKANLRSFLEGQATFEDYDFSSSGMQVILDLLAYNTYHNSIYTNFAHNEMFLDSALIRDNVVSHAKMLGYTPVSSRGAEATVTLTVNPPGSPSSVTIPANTRFSSTLDGVIFSFNTKTSTVFDRSDSGTYSGSVVLREGDYTQETYTFSSDSQRFLLNNNDADTETLKVEVQASVSNTATTVYELADKLLNITGDSTVYFLQEASDSKYEVKFGDGVLGKSLVAGNIIRLKYNVCNGFIPNGISSFTGPSQLVGNNIYTVTTTAAARGGQFQETTEQIKSSAPKFFNVQERAVTRNDYRTVLHNNAADLQTISVWGGEENKPPVYGKVYIAAKPHGALTLTDQRKEELIALLKERNVVTVDPVMVDPEYLYVVPDVELRYVPNATTNDCDGLINLVNLVFGAYNSNIIGQFSRSFFKFAFQQAVNSVDAAIINIKVGLRMQRRFIPNTEITQQYTLQYNNQLFNPHPGHKYTVSSSSFTFNGFTCYFDDDGNGNLRIYRLNEGERVYEDERAGTVNYNVGEIVINPIKFSTYSGDAIKLMAIPKEDFVAAVRSQIIQLADASITVIDQKTGKTEAVSRSLAATTSSTSATDTGVVTSSSTY